MFLYYREQNELICDMFKSVSSVAEMITIMSFCVWNNLNHNIIIIILLLILFLAISTKK
jgi:hypothetical protein